MTEKFLKARIPGELYAELLARSGAEGKRLGTFVRDVLQQHAQAVSTSEALARIEAAMSAGPTPSSAPAPVPVAALDHDSARQLAEVRLLLREIAMQTNAQILNRVAAQLAAQA
ncbi:MAG: hypothetical protein J7598_22525 [Mitsuaria chitosanitabida]|uniref:hypothetical protein n=1 Tax=Roseateles chitosanitabidus TaxID=65048 RepID=UPI001B180351|nr:hypothetical protein [Roseateles chitosanitabidus]MBO9689387.1 hypothetical protein [Roseateles chitosanitabidus]